MIYLKIILAVILSACPFLYAYIIKPKQETSPKWHSLFTAIGSQLPRLINVWTAFISVLKRIHEGMRRSDNFRKFFTLVTLLVMIAFQFVDFNVSTTVARMVQDHAGDSSVVTRIAAVYAPLMTRPHATVSAACIGIIFFFYKPADRLLTELHDYRQVYYFTGLLTLVILLSSPRFFVVAEMMEIILIAACIYPDKIPSDSPRSRNKIPSEKELQEMKKAA